MRELTPTNNEDDTYPTSGVEAQDDQEALDQARRFVIKSKPQVTIRCGDKPDIVAGRYRIDCDRIIPQMTTAFADAYHVHDIEGKNNALYAVAMHDGLAARLHIINKLCGVHIPHFANILAYEVIPVSDSNTKRLVLILQRPPEKTLRNMLEERGPLSASLVEDMIIRQIHACLEALGQLNICHGSLQPDRIYIGEDNHIVVGEFFTFPCGFYQFSGYENMLRADVNPYAKGEYGENVDYYALASLSASAMSNLFPDQIEDMVEIKFNIGAYRFFSEKIKLTSRLSDFMRGCLNESPLFAWGAKEVSEWIGGRRFNLLPPKLPLRLQRPILFNKKKYYNLRHLTHGMGANWKEAKDFLADSEAVRWLERSIDNEHITEKLFMFHARLDKSEEASQQSIGVVTNNDKILTQFLLILDPEGPLRMQGVNAQIAGLGEFYAHVYTQEETSPFLTDVVSLFFNHTIFGLWQELQPEYIRVHLEQHISLMRRATQWMRKREDVSAQLRTLYEMNPSLPCLSSTCRGKYILSAEEYMYAGEHEQISVDIGKLDEHIVAFLAHRLQLTRMPELRQLKAFPVFAHDKTIKDLLLLAGVQRTLSLPIMPALTARVSLQLKQFIEGHFKSEALKTRMKTALDKQEKTGQLMLLSEVVGVPRFHIVDRVGYSRASEEYAMNKMSILHLNDTNLIRKTGTRYGLYVCIIMSYIIAGIVLGALMYKAF